MDVVGNQTIKAIAMGPHVSRDVYRGRMLCVSTRPMPTCMLSPNVYASMSTPIKACVLTVMDVSLGLDTQVHCSSFET
jgi:hypothetical protein